MFQAIDLGIDVGVLGGLRSKRYVNTCLPQDYIPIHHQCVCVCVHVHLCVCVCDIVCVRVCYA